MAVREAARAGTLQAADKGAVDVARRFGHLVSFAAMLLSRELGVEVRPALSRADVKDPGKRVQAAAAALAETGMLSGGLRVPNAAATIEITADLRASRIRSAITVDAPGAGKPLTRLNWLLRQLRDTPGSVCVEAIAVRQRGMGPVKTIAQARETPRLLVEDPKRDLRAFTVSLSANAGTKRGKGRGSFVLSVLDTVDSFYADVVQHIKPWTPPPVKVPDDEPQRYDDQDTPDHATHLTAPSTPNGDLGDLLQASSAD